MKNGLPSASQGEHPIANIRLSTAIALADALGVDVRELMDAKIPEDR